MLLARKIVPRGDAGEAPRGQITTRAGVRHQPGGTSVRWRSRWDLPIVSCPAATACTAVGVLKDSSGMDFPLAEGWNGTTWTLQSPEFPISAAGSVLAGVSCSSATACMATGWATPPYGNKPYEEVPMAESWDGAYWTLGSPLNPIDGLKASSTACRARPLRSAPRSGVGAHGPLPTWTPRRSRSPSAIPNRTRPRADGRDPVGLPPERWPLFIRSVHLGNAAHPALWSKRNTPGGAAAPPRTDGQSLSAPRPPARQPDAEPRWFPV